MALGTMVILALCVPLALGLSLVLVLTGMIWAADRIRYAVSWSWDYHRQRHPARQRQPKRSRRH